MPTSAQRRLDQCVRLSAQLLAAQTRVDELSRELRARGDEVERLHEGLQKAERRWQLVHSPQAYLVGQLRSAEEAAEAAVAQQRSAARTLRENEATLADVREQHRLLQADLERLLQKRGSFDALRATLSRLLAKEQQDPNPNRGADRGSAGTGSGAGSRAGGRGGAGLSTSSSFAGGAPSGGLRSSSSGQGASLMQPSRRG